MRIIKRTVSLIFAGLLTISNILPVFATEYNEYQGDGHASIRVTAEVEEDGENYQIASRTPSIVATIPAEKTVVKNVLADANDQAYAKQLRDNGKESYITAVLDSTVMSESDINAIATTEEFKGLFNEDIANFDSLWAYDLSLQTMVSSDRDCSEDVSVPKTITEIPGNNYITIKILHPFGNYDVTTKGIRSAKMVYEHNGQLHDIDIDLLTDYDAIGYETGEDTLTIRIREFSPYMLWFKTYNLIDDQKFDVRFVDNNGDQWKITSDDLERPFYPEFDADNPDFIPARVVLPLLNPIKDADDDHFYEFEKWVSKTDRTAALAVYEAAGSPAGTLPIVEYKPQYKSIDKITVVWQDCYNNPLKTVTYPKGTKLEQVGSTDYHVLESWIKEDNGDEFSNVFLGWRSSLDNKVYTVEELKENGTATENVTYTAEYERFKFQTIVYKNWDGTVLKTENVREDKKASVSAPANPTRPTNGNITYEFIGWGDATVSDDGLTLTYTAQFKELSGYEITFVDWNGKVLKKARYNVGEIPSCPEPTRSGYTFTGWSKGVSAVSCEATYTAQYKQNGKKEVDKSEWEKLLDFYNKHKDDSSKSSDSSSSSSSSSGSSSSGGGIGYVNVMYRDWDGRAIRQDTVPSGYKLDPPVVNPFVMGGYQFTFVSWIPGQPDTPSWTGYAPKDNCTYKASYFATALTGAAANTANTNTATKTSAKSSSDTTSSGSGTKTSASKPSSSTTKPSGVDGAEVPNTGTKNQKTEKPDKVIEKTPSDDEWLKKQREAQNKARERFTPHEYFGNVTDWTVFEDEVTPAQKKSIEDIINENQKNQEQKVDNKKDMTQITSEGERPITVTTDEEKEESGWPWWWWIIVVAVVLVLGLVVFLIYKRNEDANTDY